MRKTLLIVLLLFLLCTAWSLPALAGDVGLRVNSELAKPGTLSLVEGSSMIPVESYLRLAGADINWKSPDTVTIEENGVSLSLTLGQSTALLNGKSVIMPKAPLKINEIVYIPLGFVAKSFGFDVKWDPLNWEVALTRQEKQDNMNVEELLTKSVAAVQKYNSYSMQGTLNTNMKITTDGKDTGNLLTDIKTDLTGQFQNNPLKFYIKQNIKPGASAAGIQEMTVEMLMDQENLYMNMPGVGWTVQKNPVPAELLKQQMDIQSDPLKAAAQMKEMGILMNYGNAAILDGKNYYVVNCTLDMNKFKEGFQKIIGQILKNAPVSPANTSQEEFQSFIQKLQDSMKIEYFYTVYINKDTLVSDIVKLDMKIDFTLDVPAPQGNATPGQGQPPKKISTSQNTEGELKVFDLGKPFVEPDVTNAKPLEAINNSKE